MAVPQIIRPIALAKHTDKIGHLAIAVRNLESSIEWYTKVLAFAVTERRTIDGKSTGMMSAVLQAGALTIVLLEGTHPESQVSQFIDRYRPGVQHVAVRVADIAAAIHDLRAARLEFDTPVVGGTDLKQAFSRRSEDSGLMLEIIERNTDGFAAQNVSELFRVHES
jgi:methylmalonyl-CoA/ethylmalonyl-CoA epimerase